MSFWWLLPVIAGVAFSLTATLRRYALARSLLDVPNARSSHLMPTPRGGGVSIVLAFLCALVFLYWQREIPFSLCMAALGGGGAVALIGFMDDHKHIAARWRLLGHFFAAAWALFWLGGLPALIVFGKHVELGWMGAIFGLFYLVWMLNLYNFMDGIDGIASVEAMCVCLGACLLYGFTGHADAIWAPLSLAVAVAGFLFWNFPPARIFMGDAGSGFLGIMLGVLSLQAVWMASQLFWAWLILLGVFIVDATLTLARRLARGYKVYEAHRSHAYQFASRHYGKHLPVTLAVVAINIFWLLPVAAAVALSRLDGALGVIVAYAPLIMLAVKFNAGERESSGSTN